MKGSAIYFAYILLLLIYPTLSSRAAEKDSLQVLIKTTSDDSLKADLLNDLAWKIKYSEPDSALYFANQALEISQRIDNAYQIANSVNKIGVIFWIQGSYEKALQYMEQARDLYIIMDNERGLMISYVNMGLINQNLGNYSRSLELLFEANRIIDQNDDSISRSTILTNIGNTYYLMEDYAQAKKFYRESILLKTLLGNTGTLHKTQMNMGVIFQKLNMPDSALYYYNLALNKADQVKDWKNIALSKANIATIFHQRDEYTKAIHHYRGAYAVYKSGTYSNSYDLGILITSMSQYFRDLNQLDSAEFYADLALDNGLQEQNILMIRDAHQQISDNYAARSNYSHALQSYKEYIMFRDSLYSLENKKEYDELLTKYETEKKEQQIQLQALIINQQQAANERNLIIILALVIVVMLLVLFGFLLKSHLERKQLLVLQEREIEHKESQLNAVIQSQEQERKRFSQDIHDGFGQLISLLKLNVENINHENSRERRHEIFENSVGVLNDMHGELKNICFNLMPQTLLNFGLAPTLKEFADKINLSGKHIVEIICFDLDERLPELHEITFYRIIQEWVNNILKYSDASKITIQLTRDEQEITLTIEDDGMGWDRSVLINGKGNGWKNIRSRSNLIKGILELETDPKVKGTMLILNAPFVPLDESKSVSSV